MKTFNKIILLVLSVAILISFSACSVKNNNENENETQTESISSSKVTNEETEPATNEETTNISSSFDKSSYSPKINKSTAKDKSKEALKKYIDNELGSTDDSIKVDQFEFYSIELIMPNESNGVFERDNYGNVVKKQFKNPYWRIEYTYTPELCDIAYFLIDAENGELLFSGYMGD